MLMGVDIEFKMFMRKVKSLLKQTTPLQICTAPFLNSPEDVSTTCTVAIFRVKVSCITSVDSIILWLLI